MSTVLSVSTVASVDFGSTVIDGLAIVTTFVPKLIGFLLILLVGYFIAKVIAAVVDKLLHKVGFDGAVEKGPVKRALSRSPNDASDIASKLVFYAVFVPFLAAGVATLGVAALTQPLNSFITLIPKIIVALILVVLGGVVGGAVKKLIQSSLGGLSYGTFLADGVGVLVILGFLKAALDEVGIATNVTGPVLITILATVAGILIVGVGGALIMPMQGRLDQALTKASQEIPTAKGTAQANTQKMKAQAGDRPDGDSDTASVSASSSASSVRVTPKR